MFNDSKNEEMLWRIVRDDIFQHRTCLPTQQEIIQNIFKSHYRKFYNEYCQSPYKLLDKNKEFIAFLKKNKGDLKKIQIFSEIKLEEEVPELPPVLKLHAQAVAARNYDIFPLNELVPTKPYQGEQEKEEKEEQGKEEKHISWAIQEESNPLQEIRQQVLFIQKELQHLQSLLENLS